MEPRYFEGVVQDDKIFERCFGSKEPKQIGVDIDTYEQLLHDHDELIEQYNEYQAVLIKHGLIKVPLTPEEQMKKLLDLTENQAEQLNSLAHIVSRITERVDELSEYLKNGGSAEPGNQGSS